MLKLACPSCGAEVVFHSKASVFAVCSFCKSTLVRQDQNLESIGKMSELIDDLTPLQIGTTGTFDGRRFELIGRLKVGYEDGFWNEWYCLFDQDKEAWLAEAQGFYAVCFPVVLPSIPERKDLYVGRTVTIPEIGEAEIEDMRDVQCLLSEGELPMSAAQGRESFSVDLTAPGLRMATIEIANHRTRVYAGKYQDFDSFNFQNLRKIDGW